MAIYSDINSFNPTIRPLLLDVNSIYQSLFDIFNTIPGERHFTPEFGFQLEDELFELIDDASTLAVFQSILETVSRWEKRITVDTARTKITAVPDENKYEIELYFAIVGIANQTFQFQASVTS